MTRVARREATEDHTLTFPRSEGFFRVSAFSPPFQRKFFAPGSLIDPPSPVRSIHKVPLIFLSSCRHDSIGGLLAVLLQEIHVQITRRVNPGFVHLDGEGTNQTQAT